MMLCFSFDLFYPAEDKAFLERKKAEEKALKEAAAKLKGKK